MKHLRFLFLIILAFVSVFSVSSCGNEDDVVALKHTHVMSVRSNEGTCSTYGYDENYCLYCNYSKRTYDTEYIDHRWDSTYTVDTPSTSVTHGEKSRHCKWYDTCKQRIDIQELPLEELDLPPKPL